MDIVDRDQEEDEEGAIAAQLENARRGIPNLLATMERMEEGDTLSDVEIANLEEIFERARHMIHVYDEHPEVQDLVAKVISLYLQITTKAVENQAALQAPPEVKLDD
ncbi:MAG: hypothetical protein V2I66_09010 [Halieaceae bacterium]|jgi:hypothetical protein|nr:hypothetical protein [Halieaceae bacterium]